MQPGAIKITYPSADGASRSINSTLLENLERVRIRCTALHASSAARSLLYLIAAGWRLPRLQPGAIRITPLPKELPDLSTALFFKTWSGPEYDV